MKNKPTTAKAKKPTAEQIRHEELLAAIKAKKDGTSVMNSSFVGVQYDAKAVDAINTVATGLVENAKALGALANVLRANNITFDCLMKITKA